MRSIRLIALFAAAIALLLAAGPAAAAEKDGLDRVTLNSGRVVEGRILEETDTQVRIMVIYAGIEAPATYQKSEILSIERDIAPAEGGGEAEADADEENRPAVRSGGESDPVVYHLEVSGVLVPESGIPGLGGLPPMPTISPTPLREALDDAVSFDPQAIVVEYDVVAPSGLGGVLLAETYGPIFEELIDDGHRIVFWIDEAAGGASLLPLASSEIYFKSEGELGGLGQVGEIDRGDEMVNKKMLSAALGHAVGMAIDGGYPPEIVRAMSVESNWLAVRFEQGKPVYIENEPRESDGDGWIILTDDGEGKNADDEESLEGNDVLNLDAQWAYRLGISRGDFNSLDDLVWELGVDGDYRVERGRGDRILDDAAEQARRAWDDYVSLNRQREEMGTGGSARDIGRQINLLKRMSGLLSAQEEILDPSGQQRANIEIQILALRDAIRRANRD